MVVVVGGERRLHRPDGPQRRRDVEPTGRRSGDEVRGPDGTFFWFFSAEKEIRRRYCHVGLIGQKTCPALGTGALLPINGLIRRVAVRVDATKKVALRSVWSTAFKHPGPEYRLVADSPSRASSDGAVRRRSCCESRVYSEPLFRPGVLYAHMPCCDERLRDRDDSPGVPRLRSTRDHATSADHWNACTHSVPRIDLAPWASGLVPLVSLGPPAAWWMHWLRSH